MHTERNPNTLDIHNKLTGFTTICSVWVSFKIWHFGHNPSLKCKHLIICVVMMLWCHWPESFGGGWWENILVLAPKSKK